MLCTFKKHRGYLARNEVSPRHKSSTLIIGVTTSIDRRLATQVAVFSGLRFGLVACVRKIPLALPLAFEEGRSD